MNTNRILLFAGGSLGQWAIRQIQPEDWLVGVDRGALFLVQNGFSPRLSIGDFDSVSFDEQAQIEQNSQSISSCDPVMKDLTDTEMALAWALEQRPAQIILVGALGSRFDHSLANVHLLQKALAAGIPCKIVDEHNEIYLIDRTLTINRGHFAHVSLLPLSPEVTGITLHGFQYPLHDAALRIGDTLGISNVLHAEEGTISIGSGLLLVIKSRD